MDDRADIPAKSDRIIDWRAAGRSARKPAPWLVVVAVAAVSFLILEAYVWGPESGPRSGAERFRFESVYMLERETDGNFSTFAVSPWFSNPSESGSRDIRFVVYAIESGRRIAAAVQSAEIGDVSSMHTQNASIDFRLNNTKDYSIEILVLEGDFLIARGYGSVGWIRYYSGHDSHLTDGSQALYISKGPDIRGGDFAFEYPGT